MSTLHALHHQTDRLLAYLDNSGNKLFWDDKHVEALDGEHHFEFKMPANIDEAEHFDELSRILVPLEDGGFEEFIVYQTEVDMRNVKQVYATAAYTDMNKDHLMNIGKYNGTLREMAALALPSTEWVINSAETNAIRTIHLSNKEGVYKFLKRVASAFDMEMRFRTETAGNRISVRYVDFVQQRGTDTKKEIEYGKDLADITMRVFNDRIVTKLEGRGPERDDGTFLTSEIFDEDAYQRWNRRGKHRVEEYVPESDEQDMTQAQLDQYTRTELNKRIASVVEYEITAASIEELFPHEKVRLGDRVRVKNPEFSPPLYADARIIRIERSILDKGSKLYTIGEVTTYTEEEVLRTFRALQRLYGVKIIRSEIAPLGETKTIWIKPRDPLHPLIPEIAHTFNPTTQTWEKTAATDASEIGGVVVGQQYNGVSITPEEGVVVDRTDGLVRSLLNATEGISIEARADDLGTFRKVFYADEDGNLIFAGIARGTTIILGGEDNQFGTFNVLDEQGEIASEIKSGYGGFAELNAGHITAPNKAEYGDFRGDTLTLHVARAAEGTIGQPHDANDGLSFATPLRTINEAIRRIPRIFDGEVIILVAWSNGGLQYFNEEIHLSGFSGNGVLRLKSNSTISDAVINGWIRMENNTVKTNLERLDVRAGTAQEIIIAQQAFGIIESCKVNGISGGSQTGVLALNNANIEVYRSNFNNVKTCMHSKNGGNISSYDNTGKGLSYAFQAWNGGFISGGGDAPTGDVVNGYEWLGGLIRGDFVFPTPPAAPTPTPVTQKQTWSATSDSGTWRADENRWDIYGTSVNNATQGTYSGYGPFTGSWFFGTGVASSVSGKTIKSIRVYLSRTSGGVAASQTARIRPHTSSARPAGNVSIQSPSATAGFSVGQGKWVTLPSAFHAGFASGSYKGISVDGSQYMKFSKSAKIEITYE